MFKQYKKHKKHIKVRQFKNKFKIIKKHIDKYVKWMYYETIKRRQKIKIKRRKEVDSNAEFIDDIKAYRNYRTELEIWKPSRRAVIAQIYQQIG